MLVVISLHSITQISSKVHAVVSLFMFRQDCTNHRHTDALGAHIITHRDDIIRKDHQNIAHSDIVRDACSGLTPPGDPVFKYDVCSGLTCYI